ncbi:MAG: class I SAM-dependent methyltransferase [Flavobacteriaceae bacterium]|nr:class I SAM-dependent methyltransferase [Flavobacteriaceae bacterium]
MTNKIVKNIYNTLLHWEGKNSINPYPIHKKLNQHKFEHPSVYHWISSYYKIDSNAHILDAGCGVGYGSIYLAKHFKCTIKGISLSDAEIKKAKYYAKKTSVSNKVFFQQQSYDNLEANTYDFIIAIESIKHSLDLDKTLNALITALKPNGVLIIIDDFLVRDTHQNIFCRYARDWRLKTDLKYTLFNAFTLKKDLTSYIKTKSTLQLNLGIFILNLSVPFHKIAQIIRGGLYLEMLYQKKTVKYYALEFKK